MSPKLRVLLLIAGLVIVGVAIAALIYTYWPVEVLHEQIPVAPTLFTPP